MDTIGQLLHDPSFNVALAFFILVALIYAYKPIGKAIGKGLDNRSLAIQKELDEALRLKEEAQEILTSYQRKQKEALEEAEHIVTKAQEDAKNMIDLAHAELDASLNKRIELAMQKIEMLESSVLEDARKESIERAISLVYTLIDQNNAGDFSSRLVNESIGRIKALN